MMMRIDDRQLGFEDRLLLLSCQPRIVGHAAVTEPAWLDGLRHRDAPILSKLPGFPARDGHRLAFSAPGQLSATAMASAFPLLFSSLTRPHGHRQHSGSENVPRDTCTRSRLLRFTRFSCITPSERLR